MAKKSGVKAITCEMCGSNDIVKQNGMYVCQFCNTKYSVEEARKLMVEGTVKIDGPVEVRGTLTLDKMVQNGETFLKLEKFDDALRVFTEITEKYPEDYRGWWGKARVIYSLYYIEIDTNQVFDMIRDGEECDWEIRRNVPVENSYEIANKMNYVIDKRFSNAWQTALAVAPKGEIYDEIYRQGKDKLDKYRRSICNKIINVLPNFSYTSKRAYKDMNWEKTKYITILVLGLIFMGGAAFFAVASLVEKVYLGLIFTILLAIPGFSLLSKAKELSYYSRSAEDNYKCSLETIDAIEFHKNNLKKM